MFKTDQIFQLLAYFSQARVYLSQKTSIKWISRVEHCGLMRLECAASNVCLGSSEKLEIKRCHC